MIKSFVMKKLQWGILIVLIALHVSGCATVQRKFTRKKKEPTHIPAAVYLEQGPYQKEFSNDYYYKSHFVLWKGWLDELLNQLGGNQKKMTRCAEEASGELTELNRYLVADKQAELKPYLDSLKTIAGRLEQGMVAQSELGGIRTELEKIQRVVSNNFYYDKVKDKLVTETIDLGTPAPTPSAS